MCLRPSKLVLLHLRSSRSNTSLEGLPMRWLARERQQLQEDREVARDMRNVDEIKEYQDARYLSSGEAAWKLLGNQIHWNYPPVEMLPVHLPNEQHFLMQTDTCVNRDAVIAAGALLDKLTGFLCSLRVRRGGAGNSPTLRWSSTTGGPPGVR